MRHHKFGHGIVFAAWLLIASLIAVAPAASVASAAGPDKSARLIRSFDLNDLSISNPAGLAFSSASSTFHVLESTGRLGDAELKEISPHEQPKGLSRIAARVSDPVNVTFDDVFGRLLIYTTPSDHLISVSAPVDGPIQLVFESF